MRRREFLQKLATGLAAVVALPVVAKQLIPQVDLIESKAWEAVYDPFPMRFVFLEGEWVSIDPFLEIATTRGKSWAQNPVYERVATHELEVQQNKSKPKPEFRCVLKPRPISELTP